MFFYTPVLSVTNFAPPAPAMDLPPLRSGMSLGRKDDFCRLLNRGPGQNRGRIMKKQTSRFKRHRIALAFVLAGCGQTPGIIIDDRGNFKKHENLIMAPEPSAESTNQGLWMDMQGGG
jgi:hypothetical protein